MNKDTRSTLGVGPDVIVREQLDDGSFRIQLDAANTPLSGRGNTPREAASHLAARLREQARLVEANEGLVPSSKEEEAVLWRKAWILLQGIERKHYSFAFKGMSYEAAPNTTAFIAEEHALIDALLKLKR